MSPTLMSRPLAIMICLQLKRSSRAPDIGPKNKRLFIIKSLSYSRNYTEAYTSGGAHLRGLAPEQRSSEETSQGRRAGDVTVSDLTEIQSTPHVHH